MFEKLFKTKQSISAIKSGEGDEALRLMFEIAISDGTLDAAELDIIKDRAKKYTSEDKKISSIIKKIIKETETSTSLYPTVNRINETHTTEEKEDLLKILWELVAADKIIDVYEENLYFKISELIKIKRSKANQIKQQSL
jgi:uncharacterized tellurite resistance protein B-like protein